MEPGGAAVRVGKRGYHHIVGASRVSRTPLQSLGRTEGAHAFLATETVGRTQTEELVAPFPRAIAELIPQLLIHKLDPELAIGNEDAIHDMFKDAPQEILLIPAVLASLLFFSGHGLRAASN
jgi:hypothetical protein